MANPTMTLISSQTLGGTTASVTFSSIPSTYNDLKLVVSARGDAATFTGTLVININADTANNYSYTFLYANSTVAASQKGANQTSDFATMDAASNTASTFGSCEIYIPNYNSTGSKPYFGIDVTEQNDVATNHFEIDAIAHLYRGTSGISSIKLTPSSGNFVQYSNFYLYGIKNS